MAGTTSVYWIGANGHTYVKTRGVPVQDYGVLPAGSTIAGSQEIDDPNPPQPTPETTYNTANATAGSGDYTSATAETESASERAAREQIEQDARDRTSLQGQIAGKSGLVESTYADLFGGVDALVKDRDAQLETQYGDQFKKATDQYADAIPQIETSYAAIGAGDSTDNTYAKVGAKKGYEDTTTTIGNNKKADKSKLGQFKTENYAKITADQTTAKNNIAKAGSTTDVGALRSMNNDLDTSITNAGVTKATLGTDGDAAKSLSALTGDNGRYEAAIGALDGILKSSMSGSVKEAAVKAVTDSAGLSAEEKEKVNQTYGNVYAEQAAL